MALDKIILIGNHPYDGHESMDRYVNLLSRGLKERRVEVEVLRPQPSFAKFSHQGSVAGKWLRYLDRFIVFPRLLRRRLRQLQKAGVSFVVHICDQADAIYVPSIAEFPHLVTCHDMIAIRSALGEFPGHPTRVTGRIYQKRILNGLRQATAVACVSEATRKDFLKIAATNGQRISVVKNALNHPYRQMSGAEALPLIDGVFKKCGTERPHFFLFHVGGNQWYKNRPGLVRIFKELTTICNAPSLVLAGQPPDRGLRSLIESLGLHSRVPCIGKVSNEELNAFYCQAEALIFPSLVEGFGWPVLEAQACGCPVFVSDIDVLNEVAGGGARYIDPSNAHSSATTIGTSLTLPEKEKRAWIERGVQNAAAFEVSRLMTEYLDLYKSL